MKNLTTKLFFVVILSFSLMLISCAGTSQYMKPSETLLTPTKDKALVRFMRPSGFGYKINFNIWDGDSVIGNSVAKSQFDYLASPGKHLFVAVSENVVFIEAEVEAGKTYYVLTQVKMGMWKARVGLIPVTKGSEYWDKVKEYELELIKQSPDTEAIKVWEITNKEKIQAVLSKRDPSKEEDVVRLKPEDGR